MGDAGRLVLVTGSARSGKSAFAHTLAASAGQRVAYVATGVVTDDEMRERIERHRSMRPAGWTVIEEPLDAAAAVEAARGDHDAVIVDCLTFLVSNLLFEKGSGAAGDAEHALEQVRRLRDVCLKGPAAAIVVTNEVGWGVVPEYPSARLFRDTVGRANQLIAEAAGSVYMVCLGIPLELKRLSARG